MLGDLAAIVDEKTQQVLPQLGSVALQSGEYAGESIAHRIAGKKTKPFKYKDKGTMAAIGRRAAVVQMLGGRTMTGTTTMTIAMMMMTGTMMMMAMRTPTPTPTPTPIPIRSRPRRPTR